MRTCFIQRILFQFALASLLAAPSSGQIKNDKKFSIVPKQLRERLVERLNLYVEYDRTEQCDKLFDLYSESFIKQQKMSKDSFVRLAESIPVSSRSVLLEYKVTSINKPSYTKEPGVFEIVGRIRISQGGRVVEGERILEARLQNGDWFFSAWLERT